MDKTLKIKFYDYQAKLITELSFARKVKRADANGLPVLQRNKEAAKGAEAFAREHLNQIGATCAVVCKPNGQLLGVVGEFVPVDPRMTLSIEFLNPSHESIDTWKLVYRPLVWTVDYTGGHWRQKRPQEHFGSVQQFVREEILLERSGYAALIFDANGTPLCFFDGEED